MDDQLEIVISNPPFIDELRNVFRLPEGAIMTVGSIIYNPSGRMIDEHLYKHETHHSFQQGKDPKKWWIRYLKEPAFRASQEIPAYQIQFQSAKKVAKDRSKLHNYAVLLAKDLSGPMYNNLMTFSEAYDAIRTEKLFVFN